MKLKFNKNRKVKSQYDSIYLDLPESRIDNLHFIAKTSILLTESKIKHFGLLSNCGTGIKELLKSNKIQPCDRKINSIQYIVV